MKYFDIMKQPMKTSINETEKAIKFLSTTNIINDEIVLVASAVSKAMLVGE